ncbi:hypothetical protein [Helicobacter suis]|nr:hypothetical protein [Helicobacter suis]
MEDLNQEDFDQEEWDESLEDMLDQCQPEYGGGYDDDDYVSADSEYEE